MTPRQYVRFLLGLILCCSAAAIAQNGSGSSSSGSQSTSPPPGITGLTIHTNDGNKSTVLPTAPASNASGTLSALAAANQLFESRQIPEAALKYDAIIKADPKVAQAQVGLMRCYLVMEKLDEARAALVGALAALPNSADVLFTAGDVQFRLGKIPEAERLYVKAENVDPNDREPYLGLARVYKAYSLYRRAYDNLKRAHEVAPDNGPVQILYFQSLPKADQIPMLEAYLSNPKINPQIARGLQQYLTFLKKNAAEPAHSCTLAGNVRETDTKLIPVARAGAPGTGMALGAVGLNVKVNKQEIHLALDTGATGILMGRAAAERLGLQRLGYQAIIGMGDAGTQGGYTAVADRIRIGDLEFQDCVVKVTDQATPVTGQDGLIGADVFSSYLIDIDIPGAKLRLSQLPKRPNEAAHPAALQTMSQEPGDETDAKAAPTANAAPAAIDLPKDAYVAPDMASWTKVYRFHSLLLVPTLVDRTGPMLFLVDTGSFSNVLSTRAAREVTQVRANPGMRISGMSGSVAQVYTADKATLQFGRYEQQNEDVTSFDISAISRQTGTEVSGILGFRMLRILQIKIDYRDGLVNFIYDPRHLPKQVKIGQ